MKDFVEKLRSETPASALRSATLQARSREREPVKWAAFALFGMPAMRRAGGLATGDARLVLVSRDGAEFGPGACVPEGLDFRTAVRGQDAVRRRLGYLVHFDPKGKARVVGGEGARQFTFRTEKPFGRETLVLVEANQPLPVEVMDEDVPLPRTLAGLAALFRWDDPGLDLRILRLQFESVPGACPGSRSAPSTAPPRPR